MRRSCIARVGSCPHLLTTVFALLVGLMWAPAAWAQKPPAPRELNIQFTGLDASKKKYVDEVLRQGDPDLILSISVQLQQARLRTLRSINAQELDAALAPVGISVVQISEITTTGLSGGSGTGQRHSTLTTTRADRQALMDQARPAHGDH
ncbi:MAG TPA: hypothetical protein PL010_04800 [Flavobacteriales bacterium]|nr:hypothetical protein [Flavobacteriales bacterium]HNE81500.1 hypothetical protein [Flavobacteriales bacterium]HNI03929.1 hypothetical protein [Flavobacteriales bacterium]HNK41917.1 hypothetical protein [Flavobacteriales bacterium]HNK68157.1 hypothetical protein [Flavobacteriales bacterium]